MAKNKSGGQDQNRVVTSTNINYMDNLVKLFQKTDTKKIMVFINNNKNTYLKDKDNDNNTICHYAAMYNNQQVLTSLLQTTKLFFNINNDGLTPLHILIKNKNYDLVEMLIQKNNDLMVVQDINKNTIIHSLLMSKYQVTNEETENLERLFKGKILNLYNIVNNDNLTILHLLMKLSQKEDDKYYNLIKYIIKNTNCDHNYPSQNYPLIYSITILKKPFISILLINLGADTNIIDSTNISLTPLISACANNSTSVVESLLKHGATVNYQGPYCRHDPMFIAIDLQNWTIVDLLLDHGYDLNMYDNYLDTCAHHIMYYVEDSIKEKKTVCYDIVFKILYLSNLYNYNINGDTPVHLIFKYDDWTLYKQLLLHKKISLKCIKSNNEGFKPFTDTLQLQELFDKEGTDCDNDTFDTMVDKIIFPITKNNKYWNVTFMNSPIYNIIYTCIIYKKYKTCMTIPFELLHLPIDDDDKDKGKDKDKDKDNGKDKDKDKDKNNKTVINYNEVEVNNDKTDNETNKGQNDVITNIINFYKDYKFDFLLPHIIIWKSPTEYYMHDSFAKYLDICFSNDKRYIYIKISLVPGPNNTHANVLLIDKVTGYVCRFDPYGLSTLPHISKLDDMLEKIIIDVGTKYCPNLVYFRPKKGYNLVSFQNISMDENIIIRNGSDPLGYCLAWCFWFVELVFANSKLLDQHGKPIQPLQLIKGSIVKIIRSKVIDNNSDDNVLLTNCDVFVTDTDNNNDKDKDANEIIINNIRKFNNYIRSYAYILDDKKNCFLLNSKLQESNFYNIVFSDKDLKKININIKNALLI